jgi:hypothetical protein
MQVCGELFGMRGDVPPILLRFCFSTVLKGRKADYELRKILTITKTGGRGAEVTEKA